MLPAPQLFNLLLKLLFCFFLAVTTTYAILLARQFRFLICYLTMLLVFIGSEGCQI